VITVAAGPLKYIFLPGLSSVVSYTSMQLLNNIMICSTTALPNVLVFSAFPSTYKTLNYWYSIQLEILLRH